MSDKQLVVELLNRLPEDAKLHDIGREIEFLAANATDTVLPLTLRVHWKQGPPAPGPRFCTWL
jgi:hypothetical protein